ncbi:MAG: fumarate hydratase [Candidatus Heimdallarchaeota archaeon]|nr:fumarate hydratase [Candidatus Heimdallarchaeota archaeon]
MSLEKIIEDAGVELLRRSATKLPKDVLDAMIAIKEQNLNNESALLQMTNIIDDAKIAAEGSLPMCQDTGIANFVIEIGDDFPIKSKLKELLIESTKRATKEIPLRPNTIDMFDGNTKNNVDPRGNVPIMYITMVPGSDLKLTAMNKGGGSSNIAQLGMLKPGLGLEGALKFAIDAVAAAGAQGCPPYRVGIGIGAGEDAVMNLAKKALLRPVGKRSEDARVARLEEEMYKMCNELPIGPMGVTGEGTVIDVGIELAARHPASLPVGVVFSCWALRHATATISKDGNVTYEEH